MEGHSKFKDKKDIIWNKKEAEVLFSIFIDCFPKISNALMMEIDEKQKNMLLKDLKKVCLQITHGYDNKDIKKMKSAINKTLKMCMQINKL